MDFSDRTDRVNNFIEENPDLDQLSKDGIPIRILEMENGILRIMIDINEDVGHTEIRNATSLALKWRKQLTKFQGRTGIYCGRYLLKLIDRDHKEYIKNKEYYENHNIKLPEGYDRLSFKGIASYSQITLALNQKIEIWLYRHLDKPINKPKELSRYRSSLNLYLFDFVGYDDEDENGDDVTGEDEMGVADEDDIEESGSEISENNDIQEKTEEDYLNSIIDLLHTFNMSSNDINDLIIMGKEKVVKGETPFYPGQPLYKEKVREVLRWFRGSK